MKAIAVNPGKPGIFFVERDEPRLQSPDDIKVKILDVGICGTDREEANGGGGRNPRPRQSAPGLADMPYCWLI